MRGILLISLLLLVGCSHVKDMPVPDTNEVDSLLSIVRSHNDSSVELHKMADQKTAVIIEDFVDKIDSISKNNEALKKRSFLLDTNINKTKVIVIRDTIYVTEKKNFWGKTRKTIDSTSNIQDTTEEQH